MYIDVSFIYALYHRRRIKTEAKAKGVGSVWEKKIIKFLSAL